MTIDLYRARCIRASAGKALFYTFCPQSRGRVLVYILMPESPAGHNNTIGLTGVQTGSSPCQITAI